MDFGRLITAMVTPFDTDLQIQWSEVGRLIDYLIDEQKNDSIIISGTTGESPTLSEEEKLQLFEYAVKHANGRAKIIAGTGSNDTAHTISLTQKAEKSGVDGILLVMPYYNRPSQEGLYQHCKAVAESTKLPIMLYNVPTRAGVNLLPETTARLSLLPNVHSTKEAISDMEQITKLFTLVDDDFIVYCGDDSQTLPMLALGAYGVVSVASHVVGNSIKEMIHEHLQGNHGEAAKIHRKLFPVFKGIFTFPSPAPIKEALRLHGMETGGVRLPLLNATEDEAKFIKSLF
ncbi:dihydrodipicolinate synthase [Paenibacillus swuensis]|uniref:4-hydroxy-tetrahydrodipicolinate synthase n=1 Tax=Paenibacillus swuensis TaxID=1178515 RepID=A0A172TKN8_9BACL|nr:4-hydroxy-tetrahydrodipicolinate synthase [Paenibacillus swuensis]ANE47590.1 dihydrodipicolinate synthase [Paenibacillus swuensis]